MVHCNLRMKFLLNTRHFILSALLKDRLDFPTLSNLVLWLSAGTQTADLEVVGVAALPAAGYTPPVELPLALAASYEAASTVRRRRGRSSRQALHYLIDLLLQPNSPNGSDDEGEGPQQPPPRLAL